jgi:membrane associated rhomboid family serine protease
VYFFYYYPLGVDVDRPPVPWLTLALVGILSGIFLLSGPFASTLDVQWKNWAYQPASRDLLRPLSAIFLHGGWLHLLGNLVYLAVFAPALEKSLGRLGLLLVFCGTGYVGNLVHAALTVHLHPGTAWTSVLGASGAISGLLGIFLLRYPRARLRIGYWAFLPLQGINRTGTAGLPVILATALWVVLQVVHYTVRGGGSGTAYGAHLGGLGAGVVLAIGLGMPRQARAERMRQRAQRELRDGQLHAAVAHLERYVRERPHEETSSLELARVLRLVHDQGRAMGIYREVTLRRLEASDGAGAVEVYREARRGIPVFHLPPEAQRRIAFLLEKCGRLREAATAYADLARFHPQEPSAAHGLARAATLLLDRLGDEDAGRSALEEALAVFPDDPLSHWLQREWTRRFPTQPPPGSYRTPLGTARRRGRLSAG